jgi:hypothetical protein
MNAVGFPYAERPQRAEAALEIESQWRRRRLRLDWQARDLRASCDEHDPRLVALAFQ